MGGIKLSNITSHPIIFIFIINIFFSLLANRIEKKKKFLFFFFFFPFSLLQFGSPPPALQAYPFFFFFLTKKKKKRLSTMSLHRQTEGLCLFFVASFCFPAGWEGEAVIVQGNLKN